MKRLATYLSILMLVVIFAVPMPSHAKVSRTVIMKTADGTAQRITTDTTIYTRKFTVQSKVGNAATVYCGTSAVSTTVFMASLGAGQGVTFTVSEYEAERGQQFQLSEFYVLGTAADVIAVNYEVKS